MSDAHSPNQDIILPDNPSHEIPECKNCGTPVEIIYCPNCGQSIQEIRVSVTRLLMDFMGDYFTFDSKLFRSLKPLFFKPGFLTNAFMQGKRVPYIPPLRMYIFCSIIFFLALALNTETEAEDQGIVPIAAYHLVTDERVSDSMREPLIDYIYQQERKETLQTFAAGLGAFGYQLSEADKAALLADYSAWNPPQSWLDGLTADQKKAYDKLASACVRGFKKSEKNKEQDYRDNKGIIFNGEEEADEDQKSALDKWFDKKAEERNKRFQGLTQTEINTMIIKGFLNNSPKALFLLMPLFALFLKLAYMRQDPLYIDHLIFAFHFHAFLFLFLSVGITLVNLIEAGWMVAIFVVSVIVIPALYLLLALHTVHKQKWWKTLIKFTVINSLYVVALGATLLGTTILVMMTM